MKILINATVSISDGEQYEQEYTFEALSFESAIERLGKIERKIKGDEVKAEMEWERQQEENPF